MTDVNRVLLLGAGFSRNWGGWLANEATEYLLGSKHLDASHRSLLLSNKRSGGFETALGMLQQRYKRSQSGDDRNKLKSFESALASMLEDMNTGFGRLQFEFQRDQAMTILECLVQFDAIFTLNYDALLEQHYLNDNVSLANRFKWDSWQVPGMKHWPVAEYSNHNNVRIPWMVQDPAALTIHPRSQPYIKLHGSANWRGSGEDRIMIAGVNKKALISDQPLLLWYHELFSNYVSRPRTRLVVIGYSFSDDHINDQIMTAADAGQLELFIIDPQGLDVLDKNANAPVYTPHILLVKLGPVVRGASRRSLREIFGSDQVENAKLWKFIR